MLIPGAVDGFDYITVANGARKWDNATGTIIAGLFFGSALQGAVNKVRTLPASYGTGFPAFWFFTGTIQAAVFFAVQDAGNAQCELRMDIGGHVLITRNGTTLATSTGTLTPNTWYHVNPKFVIDNSVGAVDVHINLASFVSVSGADTQNTANATFNQVLINSTSARDQAHDHFIFYDTTSGAGNNPTTFLTGYHVVDPGTSPFVTGAGANADWAPSTGSNYQNIDEANANDDTDYNASSTPGQIDTFAIAPLHAGSGTILGIAVNTIDRIDDATARTVSHRLKSGSSTVDGTAYSVAATNKNQQTIFDVDPATSAAPTVSARNAMNAGYKLVS